jgi:hypothetical protein
MRRDYVTQLEKRFRGRSEFVIPMDVEVHRDLHLAVTRPPKPTPDLMYGILDNLNNHQHRGLLDGVLYTVEYLDGIETRQAEKLATNLTQQLGFLVTGVECEKQSFNL